MKDDLVSLLKVQNDEVTQSYRKLITFVDATISQAFKMSGDDRAEFLVKNLISLRDFMSSEIVVDQTKASIGKAVIEMFDKFVLESDLDLASLAEIRRKKKENASREEQQLLENISETDRSMSLEKEE